MFPAVRRDGLRVSGVLAFRGKPVLSMAIVGLGRGRKIRIAAAQTLKFAASTAQGKPERQFSFGSGFRTRCRRECVRDDFYTEIGCEFADRRGIGRREKKFGPDFRASVRKGCGSRLPVERVIDLACDQKVAAQFGKVVDELHRIAIPHDRMAGKPDTMRHSAGESVVFCKYYC